MVLCLMLLTSCFPSKNDNIPTGMIQQPAKPSKIFLMPAITQDGEILTDTYYQVWLLADNSASNSYTYIGKYKSFRDLPINFSYQLYNDNILLDKNNQTINESILVNTNNRLRFIVDVENKTSYIERGFKIQNKVYDLYPEEVSRINPILEKIRKPVLSIYDEYRQNIRSNNYTINISKSYVVSFDISVGYQDETKYYQYISCKTFPEEDLYDLKVSSDGYRLEPLDYQIMSYLRPQYELKEDTNNIRIRMELRPVDYSKDLKIRCVLEDNAFSLWKGEILRGIETPEGEDIGYPNEVISIQVNRE